MREVSVNPTSLYETNEFSIKGFSCLFSHQSHICWFLPEETKCVFPTYWSKYKWISEFRRTNHQELKCWSTFCVNYFLRYYLMMQHQPTVKRVNGTHEWAHRPYQLLVTAACTNTGGKMKGSHSRAADRCPFVPRHSLSQVTSFMQLGMFLSLDLLWEVLKEGPKTKTSWDVRYCRTPNT